MVEEVGKKMNVTAVGWSPIRWPWEKGRWAAAERELEQLRRRTVEIQGRPRNEAAVSPEEFQRTRLQTQELIRRHRRLYGKWHYRWRRWVRRPLVAAVACINEAAARRLLEPPPLPEGNREELQTLILREIITTQTEVGELKMEPEQIARAREQAGELEGDHSNDVIALCDPGMPMRMRLRVVQSLNLRHANDLEEVLLEDVVQPPPSFDLANLAMPR